MRTAGLIVGAGSRLGSRSWAATLGIAVAALGAAGALFVLGDAFVRARLADSALTPTRFYARPIVLRPGERPDRDRIARTLERLGYRETRSRTVDVGEYRLGYGRWLIGRRAFRHRDRLDPGGLTVVDLGWRGRVSRIRDADGRGVGQVALEPELLGMRFPGAREDRVPVPLEQIPEVLVHAVLTIEDRRFFEHDGVDVKRVAGATIANLEAGGIVEGASTITQQLAKNLYLSPRRSVVRKLREIVMAAFLELRHSKVEILEAYLNEVYLGQDGALAIHGVGRAAQSYFGKDVTQLELDEAALLAGMIRGPSLYAPFRHPERAKARRNLVLDLMRERGLISEDAHARARRASLGLRREPERAAGGRYFIDYVTQRLSARHGRDFVTRGVAVFTTLDPELQRAAERALREGLERLERDYPRVRREDGPLQAALVAVDPRTGYLLAMVGGRDYGQSQFNRAVYARRQPGSAFKPVVAMTAFARREATLATVLEDEPLAVETPQGVWRPVNYDGRFRGGLPLREAIERSLNVPFARLGLAVGPEHIVETARTLGIESDLQAVPSLALGALEVTPLEMARAFGVFAAEGYRAQTRATVGVLDAAGEVRDAFEPEGERVYDAADVYLVTSALRGAVERGTGRGLRRLGYRGPVAAKSGTTNDYRDAWFIGYTPELAVAVWVGFDDGASVGLPGSRAALPIVARFLADALGRYGGEDFRVPRGLEVAEVDPETGLLAGPGCRGRLELFLRGTAPERSCSRWWNAGRRYSRWPSRIRDRVMPLIENRLRRSRGRN